MRFVGLAALDWHARVGMLGCNGFPVLEGTFAGPEFLEADISEILLTSSK